MVEDALENVVLRSKGDLSENKSLPIIERLNVAPQHASPRLLRPGR